MGLIRKTLSITTLGLVGWESRKELLAQANADLAATRADLEERERAREAMAAELEQARLRAMAEAERAEQRAASQRRKAKAAARREKGSRLLHSVTEAAEPVLDEVAFEAKHQSRRVRRATRKLSKTVERDVDAATGKLRSTLEGAKATAEGVSRKARKKADKARKRAEQAAADVADRLHR